MPRGKPKWPTDPVTERYIITDDLGEVHSEICGTGVSGDGSVPTILLDEALRVMGDWRSLKHKGKVPYRKIWLHWFSDWEYNELHLMGERLESDEEYEDRQAKKRSRKEAARLRELAKARQLLEKHGVDVPEGAKE